MDQRPYDLQLFLEAAKAAFSQHAQDQSAHAAIDKGFTTLSRARQSVPCSTVQTEQASPGVLPVLASLTPALDLARAAQPSQHFSTLIERFAPIAPRLDWRRRPSKNDTASDNFDDGHANAMIVGPAGLEEHDKVWLGVSLLAPDVRYPDHSHQPEEVYLVASRGEFFQQDHGWFEPGFAGSFYNRPNIRHAMRSHATPLLAFWLLNPT